MLLSFVLGIFALAVGLFFGNFGTSFYYRIANRMPINGVGFNDGIPPHCSTCKHPLRFYEYLPIFNWFSVKGNRCNYCGAGIDPVYQIFEFGVGLMSVFNYFALGLGGKYVLMTLFALCALLAGILFYRKIAIPEHLVTLIGFIGLSNELMYNPKPLAIILSLICFGLLFILGPLKKASVHDATSALNYTGAEISLIVAIVLPIYVSIPLLVLIYCLYKQHVIASKYLYLIGLLSAWLFAIL
ncbi:MAG: prepilin peptidase [Proteobacteria bacterium]|nr:prepilin peptidase [Pseudomonadota bacterium]